VFTARLAAVGWDGAVCVAARGESKVNVMGGPTAMTADSPSSLLDHPLRTSKYRLNLARQIIDLAVRIDRRFLATSDPLHDDCCLKSVWNGLPHKLSSCVRQ